MSIRIELNSDGFAALLTSSEVKSMIEGYTNDIKTRADAYISGDSEGFNAKVEQARKYKEGRWVGVVGTSDYATLIAESEQKALIKAVHG